MTDFRIGLIGGSRIQGAAIDTQGLRVRRSTWWRLRTMVGPSDDNWRAGLG